MSLIQGLVILTVRVMDGKMNYPEVVICDKALIMLHLADDINPRIYPPLI